MNDSIYKYIIKNSSFAYLYIKVFFDEHEKPFDFEILEVNGICASLLGFGESDLVHRRGRELFPNIDEDSVAWIRCFGSVIKSGQPSQSVLYSQQLGRRLSLSVSSPAKDHVAIFGSVFAPEHSDVSYHAMIRSLGAPVLITDRSGNVKEVNDAFIRKYGYDESEIVGFSSNFLDPGPDVYLNLGFSISEYRTVLARIVTTLKDPQMSSWDCSVLTRCKNGSLIWVHLIVNGVFGADGSLDGLIAILADTTQAHDGEEKSRIQIYQTIASLAELRDDDTGNHMKRVGILTKLIAMKIGMHSKFCDDIELFAPLHDIGKVGIRDSILRAPRALTDEEMEIMRTHTVLGHNIVRGKREFEMAADITLCHHEFYDGSGYPHHLDGSKIPLSAQITTIADVYDALRSNRPYKRAWTPDASLNYIRGGSATLFNPELVEAFVLERDRLESIYQDFPDSFAAFESVSSALPI